MKTPEHFKQEIVLGLTQVNRDGIDYKVGYNEALEKTNAKELYVGASIMIESLKKTGNVSAEAYGILQNAIEKANNL